MDDREWLRAELVKFNSLTDVDAKAARQADTVVRLLRRMVPEFVESEDLDPLFRKFLDTYTGLTRTNGEFGGSEVKMPREVLLVAAGASADVLHRRYGMSRIKAAAEVASWLPGRTRKTVENWAAGGRHVGKRADRVAGNSDWVEDMTDRLARGEADMEHGKGFLCWQLKRIARRVGK